MEGQTERVERELTNIQCDPERSGLRMWFNDKELCILQALWDHGPMTITETIEAIWQSVWTESTPTADRPTSGVIRDGFTRLRKKGVIGGGLQGNQTHTSAENRGKYHILFTKDELIRECIRLTVGGLFLQYPRDSKRTAVAILRVLKAQEQEEGSAS